MLRSMNLKCLNPHISCVLCGGYLVDATTIIECLHSFCKSCIVRYLETSVHCPVCDVEIHKTRPLLHIRPDRVLQDIVYKLVPGLCHEEQKLRKEMQEKHDLEKAPKEPLSETDQEPSHKNDTSEEKLQQDIGPDVDDPVCLSLEYYGQKRYIRTAEQIFPIRYLRCSSKVTVGVLKKFLSLKFGIPPSHQPELVRSDEILDSHITMRELSRIYGLFTKSHLDLQYIFLTRQEDDELKSEGVKKVKIDDSSKQHITAQQQPAKRTRRRRRTKHELMEQRQEEQPNRKRRRRRKNINRSRNDDCSQEKQSQITQLEQSTQQYPVHEQSTGEDGDVSSSRVPFEHERHSHSEIKQYGQIEEEQNLSGPPLQPIERFSCGIADEGNINELLHFKENEVNIIKHQFHGFHSDNKESLDLFKIPSLPPLRSRNLERQAVNLTDSFC